MALHGPQQADPKGWGSRQQGVATQRYHSNPSLLRDEPRRKALAPELGQGCIEAMWRRQAGANDGPTKRTSVCCVAMSGRGERGPIPKVMPPSTTRL